MASFANLGGLNSAAPARNVRGYEGEKIKLDKPENLGIALRNGALAVVRGESLRAVAMVEYSRRVMHRLGVHNVEALATVAAKDMSAAKLETDTDKIPGTAWCFGDYLDQNCRIAGLFFALMDGALDVHKPDVDGAFLFCSADLLRRDFTDSARTDAYKSGRGRPKATEAEKAAKEAAKEAEKSEKSEKAKLAAAASAALAAKAASADTFEREVQSLRAIIGAIATAAGYTGGDPAGLVEHVERLALRPVRVEPVEPVKPVKTAPKAGKAGKALPLDASPAAPVA